MYKTWSYTPNKAINTTYMIMLNHDLPLHNLYMHDNHDIHQYFTTLIPHRITSFTHNIISITTTHIVVPSQARHVIPYFHVHVYSLKHYYKVGLHINYLTLRIASQKESRNSCYARKPIKTNVMYDYYLFQFHKLCMLHYIFLLFCLWAELLEDKQRFKFVGVW